MLPCSSNHLEKKYVENSVILATLALLPSAESVSMVITVVVCHPINPAADIGNKYANYTFKSSQ